MSTSMQPVSMLMSNLNVESAAKVSPNALSAAQDTGQSQEIIREGIRAVQTVQANTAATEAQRVHRKDAGDEQEGRRRGGRQSQDSYEHTESEPQSVKSGNAPLIHEPLKTRKSIEFLA
ncbi:MAG: hypothetical protein IJS28_01165 [Synergistaceae bacterium]|nr:hypothetical protein [Synergistaceae bacterium]